MTTDAAPRATLAELMSRLSQCEPEHTVEIFGETVDGAEAVVLGAFTQTIRATGRRFSTPVALHVDDRLVTWLRVHEDSHAVAGAYAGHP
jgi:hypothetical protein